VGGSAVGGGHSILVAIVTLAMGAQSLRGDVPGSVVGVGEGMREGRSSNEGEGSGGEGRNEMEDGAGNPQAESEETTNQNSPTEFNRHPVYLPGCYSGG